MSTKLKKLDQSNKYICNYFLDFILNRENSINFHLFKFSKLL